MTERKSAKLAPWVTYIQYTVKIRTDKEGKLYSVELCKLQ